MIVHGHFGERGRPNLTVGVRLLRLRKYGPITFMVDTGATRTVLSFEDARGLGVSYASLAQAGAGRMVTGSVGFFPESAELIFEDVQAGLSHALGLQIGIRQRLSSGDPALPSLLGRDILENFRLVMDRREGVLSLALNLPLDMS